jgi:hypothetical protein
MARLKGKADRTHIRKFLANALIDEPYDIDSIVMFRDDLVELGHFIRERFGSEAFKQIMDYLCSPRVTLNEKGELKLKELTKPRFS